MQGNEGKISNVCGGWKIRGIFKLQVEPAALQVARLQVRSVQVLFCLNLQLVNL